MLSLSRTLVQGLLALLPFQHLHQPSTMADLDPTTQTNYKQVSTENVAFEWLVDFDTKIISGSATHTLKIKEDEPKEVIFDTLDLDIQEATVAGNNATFELKPKHEVMGSALHISLPSGLKEGSTTTVTITYKTSKHSTALQWLAKEQTQGKRFPFLFSQCQPIYARSLAPLQDTPSNKITYDAKVTSVLPALLSAIRASPPADGPAHDGKEIGKDLVTYTYRQPVPIPSYLLAIAVGDLRYRPFPQFEDKQWKTGVWAEPEGIEQAYWEFSEDTARFLAEEEKVVSEYRFGVYDLLVLPPSFPYGGMENACLTFLTPTLVTGDRALVDVVVHELTHSWFGNGITHAHASHFWLNEGWTTYMERLLQEYLHSPAVRGFQYIIGEKALKDSLRGYEKTPKYQRLIIDFEYGEDPDVAYSSIPYEKGANLILHLERTVGGLDVFVPYIRDYVKTFSGKSITTWEWKDHLYTWFEKNGGAEKIKALDSVDWNAWFYGEGIDLPVKMEYDSTLAKEAYGLAGRWDAARSVEDVGRLHFSESDVEKMDTNQIIAFLERLSTYSALPSNLTTHLGTVYKLSSTPNAEIRFRFYEIALADPSSPAAQTFADEAAKWVVGNDDTGIIKGRMKFCRPTFRGIAKVNKTLAIDTFKPNKSAFHPIAGQDLGLAKHDA
ncbi:peptidase family M1-domain-containing protein [Ephemerocybe angulata]|uniref:Peptidase family M1-domain-containing protein n=1 Tax=Ephemerocybe angulata TaxID=980116 RepID=A0A8H6MH75_9AGAR|nr:peptidase family M1-domain-containing protein [Tulosesus angulatus]